MRPIVFASHGSAKEKTKADAVIDSRADAGPHDGFVIERRVGFVRAEHIVGDGDRQVEPHAEEPQPGEELHGREAAHRERHLADGVGDVCERTQETRVSGLLGVERGEVFGRVLGRGEDGPEHGCEERKRAEVKRVADRDGDCVGVGSRGRMQ